LDGVKIAQDEFQVTANDDPYSNIATTSSPIERYVPELFGIKYNNVDDATKDHYGVTTVPQRYRRPLINASFAKQNRQ
jgi:hypothetical protein